MKSAKILGVTVRNDLKWNDHVDNITAKASRRIYLLKQLKRAGIDRKSLIQFYCASIRSVLEYACQAFHSSLPAYLSDQIERIQKRVLRAAVCKYRELAVKWKFRNSSYSVRKNPLVKRFRKSQSKFLKSFLFRENRQKVKSCPTPYSRRSKTFELDHFQSPREERRFEETSSSLAGK